MAEASSKSSSSVNSSLEKSNINNELVIRLKNLIREFLLSQGYGFVKDFGIVIAEIENEYFVFVKVNDKHVLLGPVGPIFARLGIANNEDAKKFLVEAFKLREEKRDKQVLIRLSEDEYGILSAMCSEIGYGTLQDCVRYGLPRLLSEKLKKKSINVGTHASNGKKRYTLEYTEKELRELREIVDNLRLSVNPLTPIAKGYAFGQIKEKFIKTLNDLKILSMEKGDTYREYLKEYVEILRLYHEKVYSQCVEYVKLSGEVSEEVCTNFYIKEVEEDSFLKKIMESHVKY